MAPEVGSGNYSRSIDIYALGVVLYEMLVGKVPFEGQSHGEVLMKHLMDQPEVDQLPAPFPQVLRKALAKDPADRYQDVSQILDEVLGSEDIRESVTGFDAGDLTQVAGRAAAQLRMDTPEVPVATAPEQRAFEGSSGGQRLGEAPGLNYADRKRPLWMPGADKRVEFAGFWIRFLAVFLDVLVLSVPLALFRIPGIGLIYSVLLLTYWNGQTVGKRACGIRVVDESGRPLSLGRAFARELSKFLSTATAMIGFIVAGFTPRKQSLHDIIASTYVIYTDAPIEFTEPSDPLHEARLKRRRQNMESPFGLQEIDGALQEIDGALKEIGELKV
jgi:uncharacterized RDD family membrane protein YckC